MWLSHQLSRLVPKVRVELTRGCPQRFLRPPRLPFRHFGLPMARLLLEGQRGIERMFHRRGSDSRDRVVRQPVGRVVAARKFYPHARLGVQTAARLRRRALAATLPVQDRRCVARQAEAHAATQRQF